MTVALNISEDLGLSVGNLVPLNGFFPEFLASADAQGQLH